MTEAPSDLIVEDAIGVCGVREDTRAMAEAATALRPPGRALDLGTGTGYIGLYLARRGWEVDAVDISSRALALARRNVERNGLTMRVYFSNLFDNVDGKFDVIVFAPPLRPVETEFSRIVSSLVRRLSGVSRWIMRVFGGLFESDRHEFLTQVLVDSRRHLNPGGRLLICISDEESYRLARLPGVRLMRTTPITNMPREQVSEFAFEELA